MKKLLLTMLAICLSLNLVACEEKINDVNEGEEINKEVEVNGPYENEMNYNFLNGKFDIDFDIDDIGMTEEEFIKAYNAATSISYWFNVCSLQTDYQDQVTLTNPENNFEMPYARVASFETYDEFKNLIERLFDEKLSKEFLKSGTYAEHDGKLYAADCGRGTDIFAGKDTYKVERLSDKKVAIKIAQEYYGDDLDLTLDNNKIDHYNYYEFIMEYTNGWHFTSFPVIR